MKYNRFAGGKLNRHVFNGEIIFPMARLDGECAILRYLQIPPP